MLIKFSLLEMNIPSSITFTVERQYSSIALTSSYISVSVEDFDRKIRYELEITKQMLPYGLNISELSMSIYKQFIYQNKQPKRLLACNQDSILITFNYPLSQIEPLLFNAQVTSTDQTKLIMEKLKVLIDEKMNDVQRVSQRITANIKSIANQQILEKLRDILGRLDTQGELIIKDFQVFYIGSQKRHEQSLKEELQKQVSRVMAGSNTIIAELQIVKHTLQASIETLNDNLKVLWEEISLLREEVNENKEVAEEENTKIYENIELIMCAVRNQFKQLNSRIDHGNRISQDMLKGEQLAVLSIIDSTDPIDEKEGNGPQFSTQGQ